MDMMNEQITFEELVQIREEEAEAKGRIEGSLKVLRKYIADRDALQKEIQSMYSLSDEEAEKYLNMQIRD